MSNLIITVISIALVAVAALMGAYYGGEAYMDGQAKAEANKVAAAFEQVSGALQLFNANGATLTYNYYAYCCGGWEGTWGSDLTQLVPSYVQALPALGPAGLANNTINPTAPSDKIWLYQANYGNGGYGACSGSSCSMKNAILIMNVKTEKTCKQLEAMGTGIVPTTLRNSGYVATIATDFTGRIGCLYNSTGGQWNNASGTLLYLAYYAPSGPPYP